MCVCVCVCVCVYDNYYMFVSPCGSGDWVRRLQWQWREGRREERKKGRQRGEGEVGRTEGGGGGREDRGSSK